MKPIKHTYEIPLPEAIRTAILRNKKVGEFMGVPIYTADFVPFNKLIAINPSSPEYKNKVVEFTIISEVKNNKWNLTVKSRIKEKE